ncbi:MAG TPA: DUF1648 domain-containing protein [Ktedonobacteraceae bacterium]|jgi:uncharacterized membrane protein|nr:DUF1648 domain-containing protein [Ktedonobacteraceae bacterium]
MDPREHWRDEPPVGTTSSAHGLSLKNLAIVIIVLQVLIAALTYPFMPEMVPSHWDAAGQVNGYMPKLWNAVFAPGLSVLIFLVMRGLISSPRLGSVESQHALNKYGDRFLIVILLFLLVLQGTTSAFALGYRTDIVYVINIAVALLLIVLGNSMGKLRRNFWIGIRTPWTLASGSVRSPLPWQRLLPCE